MNDILKEVTPLPWQVKNDYLADDRMCVVGNVDGDTHADGSTTYSYDTITTGFDEFGEACDSAEANARYIVHACNSYPVLVEALTKIRDCGEADLAKYCAAVDGIACDALTALEVQS